MEGNKAKKNKTKKPYKLALHYMETLVDVARESFLILDSNLRVIAGNPIFYKSFRVSLKQTKSKFIYELGNGQWDIPELRKLLEEILPYKKIVKDYRVTHSFEKIGERTMLLNAKQVDAVQLIILAIEDITKKEQLEKKMLEYTQKLEIKVVQRTSELANRIKELESLNKTMVGREMKMIELKKEIKSLKKPGKNGNGKNGNGKNRNGKNRNGKVRW